MFVAVLLSLTQVVTSSTNVQAVLCITVDYDFDGKLFRSQISYIQKFHEISSNIVCSKLSNNQMRV